MDDIAVYCSWADAQLDEHHTFLTRLPVEVKSQILQSTKSQYFATLADTLRDPRYTDVLFPLYKPLFPELLARWTAAAFSPDIHENLTTIFCLGRVLPLATYLRPHLKLLLSTDPLRHRLLDVANPLDLEDDTVLSLLLALFRVLSVERDVLADTVGPLFLSSFLRHPCLPVRYLAIQCLCMTMHFADAYSEKLVDRYIGTQAVLGDWEGRQIDYRVLKLWEERRWKELSRAVASIEGSWQSSLSELRPSNSRGPANVDLSTNTANLSGVLLPRTPSGHRDNLLESPFVITPNAKANLHRLGQCLAVPKPILLCGQASSGKTSLIHEAARLLGKDSSLVTLHLNEQTDAKSLLGLHTSSADGDSFVWQPGVLTKAMQQGRWVLIEDIDKAPAEVMGVLRPILENGELFLASRKETVRPKDGFRILATMKTSGVSSPTRHSWLLNPFIWNTVETPVYPVEEIETLLQTRYPAANVFLPGILRAHQSLLHLYDSHNSLKGLQTRKPTLRDLLNLSRRVVRRLPVGGMILGSASFPEQTKLDIFNDAVDCYAGHLNSEQLHHLVAADIAISMDISPQQMSFCLNDTFTSVSEGNGLVRVGRSSLQRISHHRRQSKTTSFALTTTAKRTMSRIAASTECSEPCLLVGETGVGKTTLVQHVAHLVNQTLTVINLSQQSEAGDLLGGLKPVTTRSLILPVVEKFNTLFDDTFSARRNEKFQIALAKAIAKQNWPRLMILWDQAVQMAATSLKGVEAATINGVVHASKKRKLESPKYEVLRRRWADFSESFKQVRSFVDRGDKTHAFAFVESRLVQAVREGEWVLLDEINLAPSDTLDHVLSLLHNGDEGRPTLLLAEAGNIETIVAHPNFRLFAAMNPATDAGKKDLPPGLRARFNEIYVPSGDDNPEDLTKMIQTYLGSQLESDKRAALDLAKSYLALKRLNGEHQLTDGAGETPHFSIRSLVRCLLFVSQYGVSYGLRRAMYEGFAMSFFTVLSRASENLALPHLEKHLLSGVKNRGAFFSQQPKMPLDGEDFIAFRHHLVKRGPMTPDFQPHYIRTPSVERNLLNLARAASMRRFPILLQGPTSAGKTSMVEYLAKLSGNKFVRINNHEHTDLQEYLGSYVSDVDGKLVYREGVLVDALRLGHWIVLDELNLAPSDVLEALNRLLDDNRELLIPESQEIVRPHPNFMLFATQNPAGLYGGRKRLSRAFRNRFLEIHFDDIPEDELEIILRERTQIAPSFCTKIVAVYKSLSLLRQSSRLFDQRNSFATLRDLFRWASRPVDDWESLAHHGFMLLAERVRDPAERNVVKQTLEKELKVTLNEEVVYGMSKVPVPVREIGSIVWTPAMRRVFVLVAEALKNKEPVLLVGETGCGKTQICQVIAEAFRRPLDIYNAHNNTETGDLIGSQRPVRNRSDLASNVRAGWRMLVQSAENDSTLADLDIGQIIKQFAALDHSVYPSEMVEQVRLSIGAYQALFTWSDGNLVRAMKKGDHFLLDEISLAEDSVLERLNSVLEPSRTILLAEKGSLDSVVVAHPDFQFLATMNPGGDYGKKELSAALRNRLTEIWMPPLSQEADILPIVQTRLTLPKRHLAEKMLGFATWFRAEFHNAASRGIALRDLLAWADFINLGASLTDDTVFLHGAFMIFVDSIGANPAGMTSSGTVDLSQSRQRCLDFLGKLIGSSAMGHYYNTPALSTTHDQIFVGPFSLSRLSGSVEGMPAIVFDAPTTLRNTMRIVRALQMTRPILLEGNPGVGKTAIVTALAQACGKSFARINLSDQTDLMDLFGADAPSEDEHMGNFSWQDGPLLKAMQTGGWVLLDEMNLASQSVLEGLNACLDHRREIYIAELDKSFTCHPEFTLFAAQNPHHQGGGRKGLPASFVNRFTVVYADPFQHEDLLRICHVRFPGVNQEDLQAVVNTVMRVEDVIASKPEFAQGGPWDLNLRDVNRWLRLCKDQPSLPLSYHLRTIITERFRTVGQRETIREAIEASLGSTTPESFYNTISQHALQVGNAFLPRHFVLQSFDAPKSMLSVQHLPAANSIIAAVRQKWPVILAGASGVGKTTLIRYLAATAGVDLVEFSMNADVDAVDLVGGFEQYDLRSDIARFRSVVKETLRQRIAESVQADGGGQTSTPLLKLWQNLAQEEITVEATTRILDELSQTLPELREVVEDFAMKLRAADHKGFRFVWNDGVLVDAVQKGSWLVLDNANLCNPSVLDRLNSLLEPDGTLTISEQHNGGEGTRIIEPHPNFRIFMIMDPRYGELSRAMRNRSLEILLPADREGQADFAPVQYPLASTVSRLRLLSDDAAQSNGEYLLEASIENLNDQDMAILNADAHALPETKYVALLHTELKLKHLAAEAFSMVNRAFRFSKIPAAVAWPQLAALNEPLMLLKSNELAPHGMLDAAQVFMRCWHSFRLIAELRLMIAHARDSAGKLPLKARTVLERSSSATSQKELGSAPNVAAFATALTTSISMALHAMLSNFNQSELFVAIEQILAFTQEVLVFCDERSIEGTFLDAYAEIGLSIANKIAQIDPDLGSSLSTYLNKLSPQNNALNTGFGLQLMWISFRPRTPATLSQLNTQLALEELVTRFDRICRHLPQSRSSLAPVRSNLRRTYRSIVESAYPESSLQVLREAVDGLEVQSKNSFRSEGIFEDAMHFIQQVIALQSQDLDKPGLEVLAMFTPRSDNNLIDVGEENPVPVTMARLANVDARMLEADEAVGLKLTQQLSSIQEQPLAVLNHAQEGLSTLAKALASHANAFEHLTKPLVKNLALLFGSIMHAHLELLSPKMQNFLSESDLVDLQAMAKMSDDEIVASGQRTHRFRDVYLDLLHPALLHLVSDNIGREQLKSCLVNLSLAGLLLMVPNRLFDPATYPIVEYRHHQQRVTRLNSKIEGQRHFHKQRMGQDTSFVIRLLEEELLELGTMAPPPAVFRPGKEEHYKLQEVFTSIVHVILEYRDTPPPRTVRLGGRDWVEQWASVQGMSRLTTIIDRLQNVHRAYDDFAKPILWFLKCLHLGLELASAELVRNNTQETIEDLVQATPLLSISPDRVRDWRLGSCFDPDLRLFWLQHAGLKSALAQKQDLSQVQDFLRITDSFYHEWKSQLTRDQVEAETKSRYYSYRGDSAKDEEDESREMSQLFPGFDSDDLQRDGPQKHWDARAIAAKLCTLHQKMYSGQNPHDAMQVFIQLAIDGLSRDIEGTNSSSGLSFAGLLPAILLQMESKMTRINGGQHSEGFNIYTDSDVTQSQKLFDLIQQIQARFHAIQAKWPEHAVPGDVLSFCTEVLHLSVGDPVAKLLTKTEKLHEIVSQWQSIASREWSVSELVENLTSLIISWRRLELLSWSRLLDDEKRRHEDDAQAWYFIAYEAVIYNSKNIEWESVDSRVYRKTLVQTLEEFLRSTTLGQYASRLRLLAILNKTLQGLVSGRQDLQVVATAVQHVIEHYRRYEAGVEASLQKGRIELEKALNEQIKLASWKDTNITALRDSARRSHFKLFKIVRKYRALLNQVVVLSLPQQPSGQNPTTALKLAPLSLPDIAEAQVSAAAEKCQIQFEDWEARPLRLTKPFGAAKSMQHLYVSKTGDLLVQEALASFCSELVDNTAELRKQTPSTLTEENTSLVRHLQERKRRLFADTLKTVAHMGIRRNLPTSELEAQSSTAVIFASPTAFLAEQPSPTASTGNNNFRELLDCMSLVRSARADHSDDLTDGEVNRSVGLLEGLLSLTIQQWKSIPKPAFDLKTFSSHLTQLRSIIASTPRELVHSAASTTITAAVEDRLAWLAEILIVACRVLGFQAKHANLGIEEVIASMESWAVQVKELRNRILDLPSAPAGLAWVKAQALLEQSSGIFSQIGTTLQEWQLREPRVKFLLSRISVWADELPKSQNGAKDLQPLMTLQEFDQALRDTVNQTFVALQSLSTLQSVVPESDEDPGWLTKSDKHIVEAIRSLQIEKIVQQLDRVVISKLQHLTPGDLESAKSLLTVAMPIFEQFYLICAHLHDRQTAIYLETTRLGVQLAKSFTTLASQGFCRPHDPNQSQDEQSGKLESGTGLGDGEGAEDISKDVQDDEDLSELAQQGEKEERDDETENAEDAVDMGQDDLEGETGDMDEKASNSDDDQVRSGDEDEDEIDEEAGSVDDLDPTAVDEKMWDDMKNESEQNDKEMKNDKAKGKQSDDQTTAEGQNAEGEDMEGLEGEEQQDMDSEDEGDDEGGERPEGEQLDAHVDEEKALDLPEELNLAGDDDLKDDEISDDGMDELSDIENTTDEAQRDMVEDSEAAEKPEQPSNDPVSDEPDARESDAEDGVAQDDEIMEDQPAEPEEDQLDDHDTREDDNAHDTEENAGGEAGAANEMQDNLDTEHNVAGMNEIDKKPNPQQSQPGTAPENEEDGKTGTGAIERGTGRAEIIEYQQNESLKKLADVLDQWHQRREILPASEQQTQDKQKDDVDMADADFEHVQNEEDEGNAQALGVAGVDQAQNLDQSKAIEDDDQPMDDDAALPDSQEPEVQEDIAERFTRLKAQTQSMETKEVGAFVPDAHSQLHELLDEQDGTDAGSDDLSLEIEHLELGHDQAQSDLQSSSIANAALLWHQCSTSTHQFSLVLTEQLRLILSPTTATKLRGDYRTGKRLNIKRIIPYIASNYKRDKIWMRRSVPSKRNYQIMIAVDDSKSMSESGADVLAFETLTLLTKALAMLEVGEICVVGFGDAPKITVAHPFGKPFAPAESGPKTFQAFNFDQRGTDVKSLVRQSIQLFRDAKQQRQSGSGDEQWQLQLIVSDGHISDHEAVARLVRQAHDEERIVIVFVVVDAGEESILDLREAVYEKDPDAGDRAGSGEMKLRMKRYLDGFPFPYYLVVRDVRDLPGVLATALKGWFGSVVDVQ